MDLGRCRRRQRRRRIGRPSRYSTTSPCPSASRSRRQCPCRSCRIRPPRPSRRPVVRRPRRRDLPPGQAFRRRRPRLFRPKRLPCRQRRGSCRRPGQGVPPSHQRRPSRPPLMRPRPHCPGRVQPRRPGTAARGGPSSRTRPHRRAATQKRATLRRPTRRIGRNPLQTPSQGLRRLLLPSWRIRRPDRTVPATVPAQCRAGRPRCRKVQPLPPACEPRIPPCRRWPRPMAWRPHPPVLRRPRSHPPRRLRPVPCPFCRSGN